MKFRVTGDFGADFEVPLAFLSRCRRAARRMVRAMSARVMYTMKTKSLHNALVLALALLGGCATPPWDGMSQAEISAWMKEQVGPDAARAYESAGVSASAYKAWLAAGIEPGAILDWVKFKFQPADAGAWKQSGFTAEPARAWSDKAFTPVEAAKWVKAKFSLSDAIAERAKGLKPIE